MNNPRAQQAMPIPKQAGAPEPSKAGTWGPGGPGSVPEKTFQPFGSFIALHAIRKATTDSGIVLPSGEGINQAIFETEVALVVACGPLCVQVKEGDVVLVGHDRPVLPTIHRGNKTFVLREDMVTGIVKTREQLEEMARETV